ncbi:VanZ family protein [Brevibacillus laterosporus]|uniref:VanZ family protein n=1 Tax=Brevibacillus laterosporus TaxID=1465 RepID=UPI0035A5782A
MPLLFAPVSTIRRVFFASFLTSLELGQLLFSMGSFDVDDILLNTIGGLRGYGLMRFWIKSRNTIRFPQ